MAAPAVSPRPPFIWEEPAPRRNPELPQWAKHGRARAAGAIAAILVAVSPAAWATAEGAATVESPILFAIYGVCAVVVAPLGWWLGPRAVDRDRFTALVAAMKMAVLAVLIGAYVAAFVMSVAAAVSGQIHPLGVVSGTFSLALIGVVFVGWLALMVTGPSAAIWLAVMRTVSWILTRRGRPAPGRQAGPD